MKELQVEKKASSAFHLVEKNLLAHWILCRTIRNFPPAHYRINYCLQQSCKSSISMQAENQVVSY